MPKFLWYLTTEDGRSGSVQNEVVTYTGARKPLPQTPIGWQDLLIGFERSIELHGLGTDYTIPVGLVRDAALIARDALYNETVEATRILIIQRLKLVIDAVNFQWLYKFFYRGELDFSKSSDAEDVFNVPVLESGILRLFKANRKTVYSFPMSDPRAVNIRMDGIVLEGKYNFVILQNNYTADALMGIAFINKEGTTFSLAGFTIAKQAIPGDLTTSTEYYLASTATQQYRIYGTLKFQATGLWIGTPPSFQIEYRTNTGTTQPIAVWNVGDPQELLIDFTVSAADLENFFLIFNASFFSGTFAIEVGDSDLAIYAQSRYKTTYIKAFKRMDMFRMLVGKVTGSEDLATSELCEEFNNLVLTCGDAIRGIEGAVLETSLDDFFKDCDATLMAGMQVTRDGIEIEERQKYYSEDEIINLGNCKDFVKQPAVDYMFNTFKFGHANQDIEDVNGKYDPNGNNQFEGPLTKVVKEYDMVSPYKAGPYEIEIMRINFEGKTTTDDNKDSSVYVISTNGTGSLTGLDAGFIALLNGMLIGNADNFAVGQQIRITGSTSNDGIYDVIGISFFLIGYFITFAQTVVDETATIDVEWLSGAMHTLDRPAFSTLEITPTFTNATIFNLSYLTPKTMFNRHKRWLRSMNAGLDDRKIKFTSGKENRNVELLTVLAGVTIDEDGEELISDMGDYLFLPYEFIFTTEVPVDLPELLETNPNSAFRFTDEEGIDWIGFLKKGAIAANDYTPQEYRLLAAPSNDITQLIRR